MTHDELAARGVKYGNRNVPKMIRQVDELRHAIAAEGTERVQAAWDAVEEHIDYAYRFIPATPAALAAAPEVAALIREAEVRAVDRYEMAIRKRFFGVKGFAWTAPDARDEAIAAIRAEAAALKGKTT